MAHLQPMLELKAPKTAVVSGDIKNYKKTLLRVLVNANVCIEMLACRVNSVEIKNGTS